MGIQCTFRGCENKRAGQCEISEFNELNENTCNVFVNVDLLYILHMNVHHSETLKPCPRKLYISYSAQHSQDTCHNLEIGEKKNERKRTKNEKRRTREKEQRMRKEE